MEVPQHPFYLKSRSEQNLYLLKVGFLIVFSILIIVLLMLWSGFFLLGIFIPFLILLAAPFVDTPLGCRNGQLKYYSPLFIIEMSRKHKIIIHGGTLFDYVFLIDRNMTGNERTKLIMLGYISGLLNLLREHEKNLNEHLILRGTSYILSEKTMKRFGFRKVKTDLIQKLILAVNYFTLTVSYSFAKGKFALPDIRRINTYEATLKDIRNHKDYLIELEKKLIRSDSQ
jgi:hypothetical protein